MNPIIGYTFPRGQGCQAIYEDQAGEQFILDDDGRQVEAALRSLPPAALPHRFSARLRGARRREGRAILGCADPLVHDEPREARRPARAQREPRLRVTVCRSVGPLPRPEPLRWLWAVVASRCSYEARGWTKPQGCPGDPFRPKITLHVGGPGNLHDRG